MTLQMAIFLGGLAGLATAVALEIRRQRQDTRRFRRRIRRLLSGEISPA